MCVLLNLHISSCLLNILYISINQLDYTSLLLFIHHDVDNNYSLSY